MPGSQIIVTTLYKSNPPQALNLNGRSAITTGFYGPDGQRVFANPMGSPAANPAAGKEAGLNGTAGNGQGFKPGQLAGEQAHHLLDGRLPPLNAKNVTQRPPGQINADSLGAKKSTGKGSTGRP